MSNLPIHFESSENRRRIAQAHLKLCPVCDSLNALSNDECFVCSWHGQFDHDAHRIEESLVRLLISCPELELG